MENTVYFLKTRDVHIRHIADKDKIICYKTTPDIDLELPSGREFYYLEQNDKYSSKYKYVGDFRRFPAVKIEDSYYCLKNVYAEDNALVGIFKKLKEDDIKKIDTDLM